MEAKNDSKERREKQEKQYRATLNTFKDSRKSGEDRQEEPEEKVKDRVKKGDSWIGRVVRSDNFELFLDIVLNRKQGLFWRYQHRVVLELLRNEGDQAE